MRRLLLGATVPALLLVLWEITGRTGVIVDGLSRPTDILWALLSGLGDGSILLATVQTFEAALLGLAVAAAAGILAGTVLGLVPVIEAVTGPTIESLRPIPAVAFIPLALMMFGFGVSLGLIREQMNRMVLDFCFRRDSLKSRKAISFEGD